VAFTEWKFGCRPLSEQRDAPWIIISTQNLNSLNLSNTKQRIWPNPASVFSNCQRASRIDRNRQLALSKKWRFAFQKLTETPAATPSILRCKIRRHILHQQCEVTQPAASRRHLQCRVAYLLPSCWFEDRQRK